MKQTKSPFLVLLPLLILAILLCCEVVPWLRTHRKLGMAFACLSLASAAVWVLTLWWALHQMVFQFGGLFFARKVIPEGSTDVKIRFAILYATCDDFDEDCCVSCLAQDYPSELFVVAICDDSECEEYRQRISSFSGNHGAIVHLRRNSRAGFKAGNLNYAFRCVAQDKCDWVVIVDADQKLPADFLTEMARHVSGQPVDVAFVQAGREAMPWTDSSLPSNGAAVATHTTAFQATMQVEISMFYERDMAQRQQHGFLPFLGHGGAIRQEVWKQLGGFPEFVSEDYAFSMLVRQNGYHGERVDDLRSWDGYPVDFSAFLVRLSKFAAGAAELFRKLVPQFWLSSASLTEKADLVMLLTTYLIMPFLVVNVLLSAYICSRLWDEPLSPLTPRLGHFFLAMCMLSISIPVSMAPSPARAVRYWFWAMAINAAALPVAAYSFVSSLLKKPDFYRTPKARGTSPSYNRVAVIICLLGLAEVLFGLYFWSPFSLIVLGWGIACLSFPLFCQLHDQLSWQGRLGRSIIYLPGISFLTGLVMMWLWATS